MFIIRTMVSFRPCFRHTLKEAAQPSVTPHRLLSEVQYTLRTGSGICTTMPQRMQSAIQGILELRTTISPTEFQGTIHLDPSLHLDLHLDLHHFPWCNGYIFSSSSWRVFVKLINTLAEIRDNTENIDKKELKVRTRLIRYMYNKYNRYYKM